MKEIQQLRKIAVRLGVSGTAIPIAETRLYKGGDGFVVNALGSGHSKTIYLAFSIAALSTYSIL